MANPEQSNKQDLRDMASLWYGSGATQSPGFFPMQIMQRQQNHKRLIESLKQHEGFRADPYILKKDKDSGVQTVGFGTRNNPTTNQSLRDQNINPTEVWAGKRPINESEASKIMDAHVQVTAKEFMNHFKKEGVDWNKIPSRMRNTLTNMGYQMGSSNVIKNFPSMVSAVGRGDQQRAYDESLYVVGNPDSSGYKKKPSDWSIQTPNRAKAVSAGYLEPETSALSNLRSLRRQSPKPNRVE